MPPRWGGEDEFFTPSEVVGALISAYDAATPPISDSKYPSLQKM
jgi:hypothetical protein